MIENNLVLGAIIALIGAYIYLKYKENEKPALLNSYDNEINEILNKEEYKVKGRFD